MKKMQKNKRLIRKMHRGDTMLNSQIENFKIAVDDSIEALRLALIVADGFLPAILTLKVGEKTEIEEKELSFKETENLFEEEDGSTGKNIATALQEKASDPEVAAIALIFMADALELVKNQTPPEKISDDPRSFEAIFANIYTKEKTSCRRIVYKQQNGDWAYRFYDEGWEDPTSLAGSLANPFRKCK
jgi:hypothetical protein